MARKSRRASNVVTVDFSNVEAGLEVGEYQATVAEITQEEGPNGDYFKWKFQIKDGGIAYYNTSLTPQSLWNLRKLLEALGVDVPASSFDIDFDDLKGRELTIKIDEEEYDGRMRPKMVDFWEADSEAEEEDEKPRKKSTKRDEEDDEEEEEERPTRSKRGKKDEDDEEEVEEEDEEEEEDERPRKKKKDEEEDELMYDADEIDSATQQQLESINKRHKLGVKLAGNLRRQRERVALALQEAGLMDE